MATKKQQLMKLLAQNGIDCSKSLSGDIDDILAGNNNFPLNLRMKVNILKIVELKSESIEVCQHDVDAFLDDYLAVVEEHVTNDIKRYGMKRLNDDSALTIIVIEIDDISYNVHYSLSENIIDGDF